MSVAPVAPDGDVAVDRQLVLELSAVLNPLFAGVRVCQQPRCPQESLTEAAERR